MCVWVCINTLNDNNQNHNNMKALFCCVIP